MNDKLQFDLDSFADVMQLKWEKYKGLEKLYSIVDITNHYTDIGCDIITDDVVIKRLADNRFFQFRYSHDEDRNPLSASGLANNNPMVGIEVYPNTITKIVYKTTKQK